MSQRSAKRPRAELDVSSAEEEQQKRDQKLADSHFVPKAVSPSDLDDLYIAQPPAEVDAEAAALDEAFAHAVKPGMREAPRILDMRDLVKMYPHLREGSDCRLAHAKRCSQTSSSQSAEDDASSSLGHTDATQEQHARMAAVVPAEVADFQQKRDALPLHKFYVDGEAESELTQAQLEAQLRDDRLQLPYLSASHESLLLGQAGRFVDTDGAVRVFPACARQSQCVASTLAIEHLSERIVLTSLMYPAEYRRFLKHGQVPTVARPCVLCCRQVLADW